MPVLEFPRINALEIVENLMRHRPQGSQDLYSRGYWNGAMTVLSALAPDVFRCLYPMWYAVAIGEREESVFAWNPDQTAAWGE
ncbi:MAG: hypothetical protein K6U74_06440 [Firmicutes bacterium]|nr:hypothetical protein [Bacillota bacterium]